MTATKIPFYAIDLVPFTEDDTKLLFDIRNEETVREGMLDHSEINWDAHCKWVKENLIDFQTLHLYFIHYRNDIAGFSLLKKMPNNGFELGVILKPKYMGTRAAFLAAIGTGKYSFEGLGGEALYTNVPKSNSRALQFNQKMGLEIFKEDDNYFYLKTDKQIYFHRLVEPQLKKK